MWLSNPSILEPFLLLQSSCPGTRSGPCNPPAPITPLPTPQAEAASGHVHLVLVEDPKEVLQRLAASRGSSDGQEGGGPDEYTRYVMARWS